MTQQDTQIDERTRRALVTEALPTRPKLWRLFTAYNSSSPRLPGALRAALAVTIPGAVALLLGHDSAMVLIASGGFVVIFGEGHPYRARLGVMLTAAAFIVLGATGGAFVGSVMWAQVDAGGSHWWMLAAGAYTSLIATVGAYAQNALRLPPPGTFFIVLVAGGSTMVARIGLNPLEVGGWALVGAMSAILIGMSGWLLRPHAPETAAVSAAVDASATYEHSVSKRYQAQAAVAHAWAMLNDAGVISGGHVVKEEQRGLVDKLLAANHAITHRGEESGALSDSDPLFDARRSVIPHTRPSAMYRLTRSANRHSHAFITAEKVLLATMAASIISVGLGFDRPDWGVVSALVILQWGPNRVPGLVRGVHRFLGSLLGLAVFGIAHHFEVTGWSLLLVLALCQFFAEFFVTRNYALCVISTTPLALVMGASLHQPFAQVVASRTSEILISVICASLVLVFWRPAAAQRHHFRLQIRCRKAMGSLLGALLVTPPSGAKEERRDLQYELLAERQAVNTLALDHPAAATAVWADHVEVQRAGYALVDFCTAHNDEMLSTEQVAELATHLKRVL